MVGIDDISEIQIGSVAQGIVAIAYTTILQFRHHLHIVKEPMTNMEFERTSYIQRLLFESEPT